MSGYRLQRNELGQRIKKDGTLAKPAGKKPNPNKLRSPGFGKGRRGPRPHVWVCGPDEYKHSMYEPWMKAKAQANFRKEGWQLTFEEFYDIWKDCWKERGRGKDDLCMSRKDPTKPWTHTNIVIITRLEHVRKQGEITRRKNARSKL